MYAKMALERLCDITCRRSLLYAIAVQQQQAAARRPLHLDPLQLLLNCTAVLHTTVAAEVIPPFSSSSCPYSFSWPQFLTFKVGCPCRNDPTPAPAVWELPIVSTESFLPPSLTWRRMFYGYRTQNNIEKRNQTQAICGVGTCECECECSA